MAPVNLTLLGISGISWTVVYLASIVIGFREKTYCIPLWALGLNVWWELLYGIGDLGTFLGRSSAFDPQITVSLVWACFDLVIVVTFFKFGKKFLPQKAQEHFASYSCAVLGSCLLFQLAFFVHFGGGETAGTYSSFAQNAIMSVLWVVMLVKRGSSEGQSLIIAWAKCLGTLAPTISHGLVLGVNSYVLCLGAVCLFWDLVYILMLSRQIKHERACAIDSRPETRVQPV